MKVVIKTPEGKYVGGGRDTQLVDQVTRAYLYEDSPEVDEQIATVNATHGCNWKKVDAQKEYEQWIEQKG